MIYVLLAMLIAPFVRRKPSASPQSILVVQTGKIGDFICTTPLFRTLRAAFPDARIVLVLHPVNRSLASHLPYFDELIDVPSGTLSGWHQKRVWARKIKAVQADIAICCSGGLAWPVILAMSGIPRRLGVEPNFMGRSSRFAQRLWTDSVRHDGEQLIGSTYARLLGKLGIELLDRHTVLNPAPSAEAHVAQFLKFKQVTPDRQLVGVAISAANKLKELGLPLLEGLCRQVLASRETLDIVLLGGPGDRPLALALTSQLASSRVMDSCGEFPLDEVPALLKRLDVFVGVDSGLTYMADTFDIPLVSLAGPCNMKETRPQNEQVILLQEKLPCVPCAHIFKAPYSCHIGTRACITNVQADMLSEAVLRLLGKRSMQKQVSRV